MDATFGVFVPIVVDCGGGGILNANLLVGGANGGGGANRGSGNANIGTSVDGPGCAAEEVAFGT